MASENNIDSSNETYGGFTRIIKWGTISALAAAAVVVMLISS